jgi:hypothetical protein
MIWALEVDVEVHGLAYEQTLIAYICYGERRPHMESAFVAANHVVVVVLHKSAAHMAAIRGQPIWFQKFAWISFQMMP